MEVGDILCENDVETEALSDRVCVWLSVDEPDKDIVCDSLDVSLKVDVKVDVVVKDIVAEDD